MVQPITPMIGQHRADDRDEGGGAAGHGRHVGTLLALPAGHAGRRATGGRAHR